MADLSDQLFRRLIALDAFMSEETKEHLSLRPFSVTGSRADCGTLAQDLNNALETRSVLDQATGLLMVRLGYDAFEAFDLLDKAALDSDQTVGLVAQRMVDSDVHARQVCSSAS